MIIDLHIVISVDPEDLLNHIRFTVNVNPVQGYFKSQSIIFFN